MAIRKVELLTVDANQDSIYPKTESDIVVHGNSTVKIVLDGKVDKTQVSQDATPNTIIERTGNANINIGNGVFFNDVAGAGGYLGGIGIGSGDTNGIPFVNQPVHTKTNNDKVQIWTSETAPIDATSTVGTIPKRDNERKINAHALVVTENNDTTPKGQYSLTQTTPSGIGNGVNFPMWYDFEALQGQGQGMQIWTNRELPVEVGTWTPQLKCTNGGEATYTVDGQSGTYVRVGSLLTIHGNIHINSKGNLTGDIQVHGLPFAPLGSSSSVAIGMFSNINIPASHYVNGMIYPANAVIRFNACQTNSLTGGVTWLNETHIGNNVALAFSATYRF